MMENLTSPIRKERFLYIDALRGFAIFLVVYSHVVYFSFNEVNTSNEIISTIHMPLFFFISGFIFNKWKLESYSECCNFILRKFFSFIIVPSIFGLIYTYLILDRTMLEYATDIMKFGYWFTISLFEMYFILLTIIMVVNKCFKSSFQKEISLGILFILSVILWLGIYLCANVELYRFLVDTICIRQTSLYLPFFLFGLWIQLKGKKLSVLSKGGCIIMMFMLFSMFTLVNVLYSDKLNSMFPQLPIGGLLLLLIGFTGILSIYLLFRRFNNAELNNTFLGRLIVYYGTNTLTIYLLHYFFLSFFVTIGEHCNINLILSFFVKIISTFLIILFCIVVKDIMNKLFNVITES